MRRYDIRNLAGMMQLRPFQAETLRAMSAPVSKQNHIICVAPTGSGKSLIYERAAAEGHRRTVLVTPLVALARQQFEKLKKLNIPVTLGAGVTGKKIPPPQSGAWIISPEILNFPGAQARLREWQPNLLVVDECHCLWEWGENFRPAFTLVPRLLSDHAIPHSLWLTATLPFPARLQLRKILPPPLIELGKFDLPARLQLFIRRVGWENRTESLIQWVFQRSGAGIIFVSTREATLRIARLLTATGKRVVAYHGGMSSEERKNIENQVLRKIPEVIVATSAFGMGMDYSYLNFVVLFQAPTSILSLVQTIGRVGRSEEKHGEALVFWDTEDFRLLEWTVQNSTKRRQEIQELYDFVNSNKCRRHTLKTYFDRSSQDSSVIHIPCNSCDFCLKLFH